VWRTGRERRTGVRTVALLLTLGAATVAAHAARAVRLAAAAATAREGADRDRLAPAETGSVRRARTG
jgi:hypothetical protein